MTRKRRLIWWLGLFAALLGVTAPVWIAHPILGFDDFALIDPLRGVHSFADYSRLWSQNVILDLQPVRDLIYWLQISIGEQTGFENFQLVNVLLWFGCIVALWNVMGLLNILSPLREVACTLVALHPVMHNSVMWAAGTKHILSALFIMLSLLFLVRWRRDRDLFFSLLFYVLAIASQPINIGFPIFALVWILSVKRFRSQSAIVYLGGLFFAGLIAGILNALYFSSEAYANTGGLFAPKFRHEDLTLVWKRILILGRDTVQLLLPYKPSVVSYNLAAPESLIGLCLISLLTYAGWRWRRSVAWCWVIFLLLPVSVVVVKLTSQGGVDTYLLTPALGSALLATQALGKLTLRFANLFIFGLLGFLICVDIRLSKVWSSNDQLWQYAFNSEQSPIARSLYVKNLINSGRPNFSKAIEICDGLRAEGRPDHEYAYALGKAIYTAKISDDEKITLFNKYNLQSAWFAFYRSAFNARREHFAEALLNLSAAWSANPRQFTILVWPKIDDVEQKWTRMCQLANQTNCDDIHKKIAVEKNRIVSASRWRTPTRQHLRLSLEPAGL